MAERKARPGSDSERQRLSAIAHAGSPMWGPIGAATIADLTTLVERHGIGGSSRILDLGCGPAELLRRICESTGAQGRGIDASPFALSEAERRLASSPARERVDLQLADATALAPEADQDLVLCIGPGWKTGGWSALAAWASGFVVPGGLLLLGDGAWCSDPPPDGLDRLGLSAQDYLPSEDVPASVAATGASVIWSRRANADEWAAYADGYRTAMRAFAHAHPNDPMTPAVVERAEAGWADYEILHDLLDFVVVLAATAPHRAER